MINYNTFLKSINEGLIKTYSIHFLKSQLIKLIDMIYKKKWDIYDEDDYIILRIFDKLTKDDTEIILDKIKISGFFISTLGSDNQKNKYSLYSDFNNIETKKDLDNIDFENINSWYFQIEKKFEKKENYTGKIYHIIEKKKLNKILKNGLVPKHSNKKLHHPDRIYFYKDSGEKKEYIMRMIKEFKILEYREYVIIELNVNDIICYKDINSEGFYTTDNIHPNNILNICDSNWNKIN